MTIANDAFNDELQTAYETYLENEDYGLGDSLTYNTIKRAVEENHDMFVACTLAYKTDKLDESQYKAAIANTLHALIYQCVCEV